MNIKPYDRRSYLVTSDNEPDKQYLVDLEFLDGNGKCSCQHFEFRLEPKTKEPDFKPSDATRCKHILACFDYERISKVV